MSQQKIAIVTGANRGLGRSEALALAADGVDVVVTYRSHEDEAASVVAEIEALGQRGVALHLDASQPSSFAPFVDRLRSDLAQTWGREDLDILVNNAGNAGWTPLGGITLETVRSLVDVHFVGVVMLTEALLPLVVDGGRVINTSSGLARFSGDFGYSVYSSTKGAVARRARPPLPAQRLLVTAVDSAWRPRRRRAHADPRPPSRHPCDGRHRRRRNAPPDTAGRRPLRRRDGTPGAGAQRRLPVVHRPVLAEIYPPEDRDSHGRYFTADLRHTYARDGAGSRAAEIVAGLEKVSPEFRIVWAQHEVTRKRSRLKRLIHPEVGELEVYCQTLYDVDQSQGLLVFTATPGSESHDKLQLPTVIGSQTLPD